MICGHKWCFENIITTKQLFFLAAALATSFISAGGGHTLEPFAFWLCFTFGNDDSKPDVAQL